VALVVVLSACGADEVLPPPSPIDAAIDSPTAACTGSPPSTCEETVATIADCPGLEICTGVCGAAYDCCYCEGTQWMIQSTDCEPCPDAAEADAP
jgi:hypothetical protein